MFGYDTARLTQGVVTVREWLSFYTSNEAFTTAVLLLFLILLIWQIHRSREYIVQRCSLIAAAIRSFREKRKMKRERFKVQIQRYESKLIDLLEKDREEGTITVEEMNVWYKLFASIRVGSVRIFDSLRNSIEKPASKKEAIQKRLIAEHGYTQAADGKLTKGGANKKRTLTTELATS